jgi:ketosteroid isomerase-like protein
MIRKLALSGLPLLAQMVALTGCGLVDNEDAAASDPATTLAAIRAVAEAQAAAVEGDDLAGAIAAYAPGAILVPLGDGPVSGPAIGQTFEALLADPSFAVELLAGSDSATLSSSGDLAVTGYTASLTRASDKAGSITQRIINQTVWQIGEAGTWQIVSDINTLVPDPAAATAAAAHEPQFQPGAGTVLAPVTNGKPLVGKP